jgi:hypothetical protein
MFDANMFFAIVSMLDDIITSLLSAICKVAKLAVITCMDEQALSNTRENICRARVSKTTKCVIEICRTDKL